MPFYGSQPTMPLYRLLEEVLRGEIRVPFFQNSTGPWHPPQRGELLDSIQRGYPIGTILLWSISESVRPREVVGGARIPAPSGQQSQLVLDGNQRLSTLLAILGPGLSGYHKASDRIPTESWAYDISDKAAETVQDPFVLIDGDPPRGTYLPLGIILDRVMLNGWLRDRPFLSDKEIACADAVRDRFRGYNLPVAYLGAESLEEAARVRSRINASPVVW